MAGREAVKAEDLSLSLPTNRGCPTSRWFFARCGMPRISTFMLIEGRRLRVNAVVPHDLLRMKMPQLSAAGGENFRQLLWWDHFQLLVSTIPRLLVRAPPSELRHVPETAALHVLVSNFHHQLRP
jgi:hypothetical protein